MPRLRPPGLRSLLLGVAGVALMSQQARAQAFFDSVPSLYIDTGISSENNRAQAVAIGALIPTHLLAWVPPRFGTPTLLLDISVTQWRTPRRHGGHHGFTQFSGLGVLRHPLGESASPWFVDLGFGLSVFNRSYVSETRRFSTAFQFVEVVGLGYRFGKDSDYEVSVRFRHISNGGIREPNPGQNLVGLRFAAKL